MCIGSHIRDDVKMYVRVLYPFDAEIKHTYILLNVFENYVWKRVSISWNLN